MIRNGPLLIRTITTGLWVAVIFCACNIWILQMSFHLFPRIVLDHFFAGVLQFAKGLSRCCPECQQGREITEASNLAESVVTVCPPFLEGVHGDIC